MNIENDILIEKFLRNELSQEERNDFLERIETDADFREQYLMEKQLFETLDETNWSFMDDVDTKELREYEELYRSDEIQNLKAVIQNVATESKDSSLSRSKIIGFISGFAAAVVIGFILLKPMFVDSKLNSGELYAEYAALNNLPSFVERGDNPEQNLLIEGEEFFDAKNYADATKKFYQFLKKEKNISSVYIYIALAETELSNYTEALNILNQLKDSDLIDAEKAFWYKSLVYLRSKDISKAKKELNFIVSNSLFNKEKAKELLEKIK
jgi:tetratricopeptide (TPR) repeat protein